MGLRVAVQVWISKPNRISLYNDADLCHGFGMAQAQKMIQHVKGHDFQGNPVEELKTSPDQLSLFQQVLSPGSSSTVELYDAMPKYFSSTKEMEALRRENGGQFLKTMTRSFMHRGEEFELTIRPARLNSKDGEEREYYPSKREDLIEDAARKLARNPENGIYLGGSLALQCSLSELSRELERTGHGMTYSSLIAGLTVNNLTHTTLKGKDGKPVVMSSIFPVFIHADRKQWEENPGQAKCYIKFHPLITLGVDELQFRDMDYDLLCQLDRMFSRWLFKRMSHLYTNAAYDKPYHISLSTLIRDSQLLNARYVSENYKSVKRTLDEFKEKGVIMWWDEKMTRGRNNSIADVVFKLYPSRQFVDRVINANQQQQRLCQLATG